MNVFDLCDGDANEGVCRIFGGDSFESGRILLTTGGRAFVKVSPFAGLGEFRRGNRKHPPSNAVLHAIRAIFIAEVADKLAGKATDPAASLKEAEKQLEEARRLEEKAINMRIDAALMLGAPVAAARSADDFRKWFDENFVALLSGEEHSGIAAARREIKTSLAAGSLLGERAERLTKALAELTKEHRRPPTQAELWKTLSVLRDDRKGWRDSLKLLGFDWLPSGGKGGRPRKP